MMKYILAALLVAVIAVPVSASAKTYTVPEEFSFQYPNNWKVEDKENRFTTFDAKLKDKGENFEVTFEALDPSTMGLDMNAISDERAIEALEAVAQDNYDATIYESGADKYTINNQTAPYTIGTFSQENLFGYTKDMVVMSVMARIGNEVLILQYLADENDFDNYLPKVEEVLKSITPLTSAQATDSDSLA